MQNTKPSAPLETAWPMPKGLIWGLCVPAPIAGSILYYVWRNSHPEAARYANRASWVCWGTLIGAMLMVSSLAG